MAYTPQHIANYFLDQAKVNGEVISPLKLIKLVYIAYGWYLALVGKKLFDEQIEAWQHGPVIPSVYHEFKHYRSQPIEERSACFDMENGDFMFPEVEPSDEETLLVLRTVWRAYRPFSGWALRNKTHEKDTPWYAVYKDGTRGMAIPDDLIGPHFKAKIREYIDTGKRASVAHAA